MEIWLPAPSGVGNGCSRRDDMTAAVDGLAEPFDVQAAQQLVSQACCCTNTDPLNQSVVPGSPIVIQDREFSADLEDEEAWPLSSSNPARWPANQLATQLESREIQPSTDSSLQFDPAAGSITPSTLPVHESPADIPEIEQQNGARFQSEHCHVRRPCRKRYIMFDQNGRTGKVRILPPENNTLGAGFDGPANADGTTIAMAYAAIQEMKSAAAQVPTWKSFLRNELGTADVQTITNDPLQEEPESTTASSCGSYVFKESTDDMETLLRFDEEMSSTGETPAPYHSLAHSDTQTSTSVNSLHLKSEDDLVYKCDECDDDVKRSCKRLKRFRHSAAHREEDVDDDAYEEDEGEVNSCPRLLHEDQKKTSCRRSLQAAGICTHAVQCNHPPSSNNSKRSEAMVGSLESLTSAPALSTEGSSEESADNSTSLKLRKTVNVLRGIIPGGEDMTDTSLVLDEAIHYVKLLQLHVQMLESQRMDTRIHTW